MGMYFWRYLIFVVSQQQKLSFVVWLRESRISINSSRSAEETDLCAEVWPQVWLGNVRMSRGKCRTKGRVRGLVQVLCRMEPLADASRGF